MEGERKDKKSTDEIQQKESGEREEKDEDKQFTVVVHYTWCITKLSWPGQADYYIKNRIEKFLQSLQNHKIWYPYLGETMSYWSKSTD